MSVSIVKRKILLEDSIDRTYNSPTWGLITATTFYINVLLTQNIDDMGLFTDLSFIASGNTYNIQPDYTILINKLNLSGITSPFMSGGTPLITGLTGTNALTLRIPSKVVSGYYDFGNLKISGSTDSKLEDVRSYDASNPFRVGFNTNSEGYISYNNLLISGVSRVTSMGDPRIYVFDTLPDANIGTTNQIYGLRYLDYTGSSRQVVIDNISSRIPLTNFNYIGEGWNMTNVSLSALVKEEYLFGIISPPEIQSDVIIDRGITTVMDMHLRLSEINDLGHLSRYGNGYYKLSKQ